jgi:hypothetical protein
VTLAERRDAGMIQRIQRFTTQRIPVTTVAGLEPRLPAPSERPQGAPARPGFAPRRGHGGPGGPGGGRRFAGPRR